MEIKEIKEKSVWENFLLRWKEKTFLQSWNWGEFNKAMGDRVWRLGIYQEISNLVGAALVIKIAAKRGTFLLVPHLIKISDSCFRILVDYLKELAKKERADFIRIAPAWEKTKENSEVFKQFGFREAPIHLHPEITWILDITPPEEDLLMNMRKTTRYLIRQGLKNPELKIDKSQSLEDIEKFNKLYQQTVYRHHFVPFSLDYLKNEFLAFLPDNQVTIFFGKYKQETISSAIIIFWQNIAFYHHGASCLKYPKIPASYLLQWEAIREAKKRGCKIYNFWGIASDESRHHPWAGLTLFKMGFGGQKKEYLKTQDLPLSKKYWLTYIFEKIRKIKRGF